MDKLGINLSALIVQLLAFIALIWALRHWGYRPILNILDQRADRIRQSMEQADRIERQLAETEQRNQAILQEARGEAQQIVARARELAEAQVAQTELRREYADLVIRAASRVVRQELDPQRHVQLIDQTLREAEAAD